MQVVSLHDLLFEETINTVANQTLALFIANRGKDKRIYVLYNPNNYITNSHRFIVGYIEVELGGCSSLHMVTNVAARSGYGALMYEIALSDNHEGLVPDNHYLSNDAVAVWNKFYQREDIEVITRDLLNLICPRYVEKLEKNLIEDSGFIVQGIRLKYPLDFSFLVENHNQFASDKNEDELEMNLAYQGKQFFTELF